VERRHQVRINPRALEDIVGMHRHRGRSARIVVAGRDHPQVAAAHILECARGRADVARGLRRYQDEGKIIECAH